MTKQSTKQAFIYYLKLNMLNYDQTECKGGIHLKPGTKSWPNSNSNVNFVIHKLCKPSDHPYTGTWSYLSECSVHIYLFTESNCDVPGSCIIIYNYGSLNISCPASTSLTLSSNCRPITRETLRRTQFAHFTDTYFVIEQYILFTLKINTFRKVHKHNVLKTTGMLVQKLTASGRCFLIEFSIIYLITINLVLIGCSCFLFYCMVV